MGRKMRRPVALVFGPNPDYVRADQERRRSGAAGRHDNRPHRQRTRGAARAAAIRAEQ